MFRDSLEGYKHWRADVSDSPEAWVAVCREMLSTTCTREKMQIYLVIGLESLQSALLNDGQAMRLPPA